MSAEIEITDANFDAETGSGVTLIDFWAPWCGPCKMQGPIVEKVAEQMAGKAKVGKCNVDENQSVANRFGIQSIPTLIILEDGKETDRLVGVQQEKVLVEKLTR
ncbi:MAG: thioredoxin [Chloroflexota bacterium]|nr:thioredoxin [Chloroflexota bacterium]